MLKNFLIVAWRNILRRKGYAVIHVIGLGVGICACLAIWSITHYELSFDKFHPDRERIYRAYMEVGQNDGSHAMWGDIPEPAEPALRKELTGLETVAQFHNIDPMISIPGANGKLTRILKSNASRQNDVVLAEPEYFDIFKYQWVAGDPSTLKEPFHVVLSMRAARKLFGHEAGADILGRTIIYDDSIPVTVTGLVKDLDQITDFTFNQFISYATARAKLKDNFQLDNWGNSNSASETFVKIAKGASLARIDAQMQAFTARHRKPVMGDDEKTFLAFKLQPLSDLHYNQKMDKNYGHEANLTTLYRMMGVAVFILILASINFINLSTAQSLRRAKEIGIRKVLGSRRAGLIVQFMSETLLLALAALAVSLIALRPLLSAFPEWVPAGAADHLIDPSSVGFALGVVVVAALLSGLYPALVLSSFQPARTLKGEAVTTGRGQDWLGKGLVVFQFTISAIFVISSIVVAHQMRFMLHKDMGYSQAGVITFDGDYNDPMPRKDLLAQRVRLLPGVDRVSQDMVGPTLNGWSRSTIEIRQGDKITIDLRPADTNYLAVYGFKLLAGRNYFASDTIREVVINNAFAKALGFKRPTDAIGFSFPFNNRHPLVAGVVADFNTRSAQFGFGPAIIYPDLYIEPSFSVRLRTSDKTAADVRTTIAAIEKDWKELFPNEPFRYYWIDESVKKLYDDEARTDGLINLAMVITIVVSGMGLFGLAALAAGKRTKEIGIRKVLGAGVINITAMITKDFVLLVAVALVIASPVAWYFLHGWLADYQNRVTIGWWVFGLAGMFAVAVAVLTVGFHAVRAALISPVKSLRSE